MKTFEEFRLWDDAQCEEVIDVAQTRGESSGHSEGIRSATRWWLDANDFPEICEAVWVDNVVLGLVLRVVDKGEDLRGSLMFISLVVVVEP